MILSDRFLIGVHYVENIFGFRDCLCILFPKGVVPINMLDITSVSSLIT